MTAHLRLNGIYWGLTALCTMGHQDALPREEMVEFVIQVTNRLSVAQTSSEEPPASALRYLNLMTRERIVMASSGSIDNEVSFLYPGIVAASAEEIGMYVGVADSAALSGALGSFSLSPSLDLEATKARIARVSISWKTPSRRNAGLYSTGTLSRSISTS